MPRGFAMRRLLVSLALCLAGAISADPGMAQPVGGPTTGGNDPTGGNTTGGNTTGGNTTGGNVNTGGNVGVNVGEERRYIVEFQSFKALDETGCDSCGSDEILIIIRTADYALISSEYGDIDSYGLAYRFKRCAQPAADGDNETDWEWECDQNGKAAPLSFTISAYEDDGPRAFHNDCWADQIYRRPDGQFTDLYPPNQHFCIESEGRGEFIGKAKVEFKLEDLDELRAAGQSFNKSVHLIGGCDSSNSPCSSGGEPDYLFFYKVTRAPDASGVAPVNPNP
jgi:hypothetical protein